jgi:outer membrane protein TolC
MAIVIAGLVPSQHLVHAQEQPTRAHLLPPTTVAPPAPLTEPAIPQVAQPVPAKSFTLPEPEGQDKPLPINLPTALQLARARPLDIALATERITIAVAQLERAQTLWLPTIYLGGDYFRHDGQLQDVAGNIFGTSKSNIMAGVGPSAVFAVTDAIFEPLAQRQFVQARQADLLAARNDTFLAVAEAYLNVQQARGDLAAAEDAVRWTEELLVRTRKLIEVLAPVDEARARTELARRRQLAEQARERWRTASADLARILRLDPSALVQPLEPPHLQVTFFTLPQPVDDLIAVGLTNRPELAAQQAVVQATLQRLKAEQLRPLLPSVLLRGTSTNPAGTLAAGVFGGGRNEQVASFSARSDWDLQVVWEFQGLLLGNLARMKEKRAENQAAVWELFRTQDRIAAEVKQAYDQAHSAAARLGYAEKEVKDAQDSLTKHFEGFMEPQRVGKVTILLIRPQEVQAAIQALAQAYSDYYGAVADYDRAQFRLYRALGNPANEVPGSCGNGFGSACALPKR